MRKLSQMTPMAPTKLNFRWLLLIIIVLFLVMLVGCKGQQKFPADMPDWVRDYISEHQGFMAALERGLLYDEPIVKEQDGVILKIWGVYVEPSATGVIYTVENYGGSHGWAQMKIAAVNGKEVNSRPSYAAGNYYAGFASYEIVEDVKITSEGEHTLTVVLPQGANLTSDIVIDLKVDPSIFKDFYDIKKLTYEETKSEVTLKIDRVIYSPTQIWIEYSLAGEKIRDAYLYSLKSGDIKFNIDGKTIAIINDQIYHFTQNDNNDTIYKRGLVLPRPREITNDTRVVFNKGSLSYHDIEDPKGVTFADPFELKLPIPDETG